MNHLSIPCAFWLLAMPLACGRQARESLPPVPECPDPAWAEPPVCGTDTTRPGLIPGPGQPGFDHVLAAKADMFDRQFHALNAFTTGVNADLSVALDMTEERALVEEFVSSGDGWDFEAWSGRPVTDVVSEWQKVAGLYAGAGIAADAFRYGTLRDTGADCEEVDRARVHLLADMDVLHMAVAITGVSGVIARGFIRTDTPAPVYVTTPLFDAGGNPLPEDKNNGEWREDNSGGLYPDFIWEDSCSRDMYIGWVMGMAAVWEVVRLDPAFPQPKKDILAADAAALARSLMIEDDRGFDLQIHDADGRITLNGHLHEEAFDRFYLPPSKNGQHAIMALGIVAALAFMASQDDIDEYLYRELIEERKLPDIALEMLGIVDAGTRSNYSNYNMAFLGGFMATRYLCDPQARDLARQAVQIQLYDREGRDRQPADQAQTFYDLVYVIARAGGTVVDPLGTDIDDAALGRGLGTLEQFWSPPFWSVGRVNCDEVEIAALECTAIDGSTIELSGYVGRGDALVAADPLPMSIRPVSNYYWRSDPYLVNDEADGSMLLPGVDFRLAYWLGRWVN